jgi:Rieske Fe-S protein
MSEYSCKRMTQAPDGKPAEQQPAWRRDFPVDWPQDHYVARRDFTKFMVLTSLAFTVGQFWIGIQNWFRGRKGAPPVMAVAAVDEVPVGGSKVFSYPSSHDPCVLVRLAEDQFVAFDQKCTHLQCAVIPQVEKGHFLCPCHKGFFDLHSGRAMAGPPRRPLARINIEVKNGHVYATGVELRTT